MYGVPNAPTVKSSQSSQGVVEFEESYFSPDNLKQFASLLDLTIPAVSASHIVGTNDPSCTCRSISLWYLFKYRRLMMLGDQN